MQLISVNLLDYVVEADSVNSFRAAFRPITSSIKCTEHARIFWPTSIIIFTLKMLLTCESVITVDMVQRLLCYEVTAGLHSPLYVQCPPVSGTSIKSAVAMFQNGMSKLQSSCSTTATKTFCNNFTTQKAHLFPVKYICDRAQLFEWLRTVISILIHMFVNFPHICVTLSTLVVCNDRNGDTSYSIITNLTSF